LSLGKAHLASERYLRTLKPSEKIKAIQAASGSGLILGSYEVALLCFKLALTLLASDADTTYLIGQIYSEIEDEVNASNFFERAKRLYKKNNDTNKLAQVQLYAQQFKRQTQQP